ncbi:hypothetical protein [Xylella fastidiosa]|uniref:hypothetical protein n=1 Tax=Xylella fastidiosa TaxID=2371 RepID=UPI0000459762|nr:hypothetical protein [Xylella fastidiosa]MDD0877368.1 hypothetical protein [Xylella fastidiosa subsp. multiplex]MDD0898956.1 hypothetical protein [Xylella fastidiosa subsp. multiplex]MDD0947973.1 hypothetical protein [Xylella fastidiosa subsp. multiplex]MDD0954574.1 hypothetical protein [Xylella fastidiosa subsp. multiplex]
MPPEDQGDSCLVDSDLVRLGGTALGLQGQGDVAKRKMLFECTLNSVCRHVAIAVVGWYRCE